MRGYCGIGLHQPKCSENVGSVLRAAGCYGATFVATTGKRYGRSRTDTMKDYRHMPLFNVEELHTIIPFDCVPVAVDLLDEAIDITTYQHPERAFYIFGPEDGMVPSRLVEKCRDKIYIPTRRCLNLAMTVNAVLFDRNSKYLAAQCQQKSTTTNKKPPPLAVRNSIVTNNLHR